MIQDIREEIDRGMLGARERIAMGPLKHIYTDPIWSQACRNTRRFADHLAEKALNRRKTRLSEQGNTHPRLLDRFAKQ